MRYVLLFLCCVCCSELFSQDKAVDFSAVLMKREGGGSDIIQVKVTIKNGWWLFDENIKEEIAGVKVFIESESVKVKGLLRLSQGTFVSINDPVFQQRMNVFKGEVFWEQEVELEAIEQSVVLRIEAFASNGAEFVPLIEEIIVCKNCRADSINDSSLKINTVELNKPASECGEELKTSYGIAGIFFKGFGGGIIALLMPCIFPMLPVTVSYFMKGLQQKRSANDQRNRTAGFHRGLLYGLFIFVIYLLASLPFHIAGNVNPQVFNEISTNVWVNLIFFAVFILFGLSLAGVFELSLPSWIVNSTGRKSDGNSIAGIFFMALTLAVVSFSCTGPILGFLLVNSITDGNGAVALTAGLAGFGLALALPFGLFAMFPQWMKRLPKSGDWMDVIKKSLAFIEVALAFKFLSNADTVQHWGILKREVLIAVWMLIATGLALYLFGAPLFANYTGRRKWQNVSLIRKAAGGLVFLFVLYLIPGLTATKYSNLHLLSGLAPPLHYSIYKNKGMHEVPAPHVVNDYAQALKLAKQENKPLLIDFTGWACVNCRKMEEHVWSKPEVSALLREKFILLSLYVDDKEKLPVKSQFSYTDTAGTIRMIKTVGDKWSTFQAENFGSVSQPQYVIISPGEELLNRPVGYSSAKEYTDWLKCGIEAYKSEIK